MLCKFFIGNTVISITEKEKRIQEKSLLDETSTDRKTGKRNTKKRTKAKKGLNTKICNILFTDASATELAPL